MSFIRVKSCYSDYFEPSGLITIFGRYQARKCLDRHEGCGVNHTQATFDIRSSDESSSFGNNGHGGKYSCDDLDKRQDRGFWSGCVEFLLMTNLYVDTSYVFSAASWGDHHLTEWIQPASLRAPEVILGMNWDCKVDVWSTACMVSCLFLAEAESAMTEKLNMIRCLKCCTEICFFVAKEATAEDDHLAQMIELLGPIPTDWLLEGSRSSRYFDEQGKTISGTNHVSRC